MSVSGFAPQKRITVLNTLQSTDHIINKNNKYSFLDEENNEFLMPEAGSYYVFLYVSKYNKYIQ